MTFGTCLIEAGAWIGKLGPGRRTRRLDINNLQRNGTYLPLLSDDGDGGSGMLPRASRWAGLN